MPTEAWSTSGPELSGERVLVTGGSGFLGAHVVAAQCRQSWGGAPSVSLEQGLTGVTGEWGGRNGAGAGN
jgi:hypothetical protein